MIKKSTYTRSFTPLQKKQMQAIQDAQKIKTVPEILFFALDQYTDQRQEIERLKRLIEIKKKQVSELKSKIDG